ncbi:MAG: AAA family ATPase [Marmoricola sp.]
MTILWEPDNRVVENVKVALGDTLAVVDTAPAASRAVLGDGDVSLVVVGPDVDLSLALDLAEQLRLERAEVGVVLMRGRLDVALLGDAARAGVREVVAADDLSALVAACRRSQELSVRLGATASSRLAEGRVVTVFSAKGGCGKTTVATNIAAGIAAAGTARVLLVDLDLAFGDVAVSLGLDPDRSIVDLTSTTGHLDADGLSSAVTHHSSGLDVLAAPKHPSDADLVGPTLVGEVLRVAKRRYDLVVVDTPPAFTDHVLASFDTSDLSLILATLDIPSIKNLRLALETMDLLGLPEDLRRVVINRANVGNGLTVRDAADAIRRTVDAEIPESRDVPAATNRGVPLAIHAPKHPVSVAVRTLVGSELLPHGKQSPKPRGRRAADRISRSPRRWRSTAARAEA